MARQKGTFDFSANLEGIIEGPIDAKQIVQTQADLINPATWDDGTGTYWIYNGMIVAVGEDPATILNGLYILRDKDNFTDLENWLNVGSPIQNQELVNRTIYCDPTGSDTTGDGSVGNPFRQPLRALEDIGTIIGVEITIQLNAGVYEWNEDTRAACQARTVLNGLIEFVGEYTTIHSGVAFTATSPNGSLYNATKAGLTLVADELVGLFVNDGGRANPISWNGAGVAAFQIEWARPNRNGTKDVIDLASTIEITGEYALDMSFYNDVSSEINFKDLKLEQVDGENMHFEYRKTTMWFQQCFVDVPAGIIFGQFSMSWNMEDFRMDRCFVTYDGTDQRLINIRRNGMFLNLSRCVLDGRTPVATTVGTFFMDGKDLFVTLLTCIFRGPGLANFVCFDGANYNVDVSEQLVIRDYEKVIRPYRGRKEWIQFSTENPKAKIILENCDYLIEYFAENLQMNWSIQQWTGKVSIYGDVPDKYIVPQSKVNIQLYDDHYPEISRGLVYPGLAFNTTHLIGVGDITLNTALNMFYSISRNSQVQTGIFSIINNGGVLTAAILNSQQTGATGVTLAATLTGNQIDLNVVVDNSSATNCDFRMNIDRTMI